MTIRLVLADDHPIILDSLDTILRNEEDFEVLACCGDGAAAMEEIRQHRPDVAVLDSRMPMMSGLAIARQIFAEGLPTRVVLFTAELDDDEAAEATKLGVTGIVLKGRSPRLLVQCIRTVHAGERWVERQAAMKSLERELRRSPGRAEE